MLATSLRMHTQLNQSDVRRCAHLHTFGIKIEGSACLTHDLSRDREMCCGRIHTYTIITSCVIVVTSPSIISTHALHLHPTIHFIRSRLKHANNMVNYVIHTSLIETHTCRLICTHLHYHVQGLGLRQLGQRVVRGRPSLLMHMANGHVSRPSCNG